MVTFASLLDRVGCAYANRIASEFCCSNSQLAYFPWSYYLTHWVLYLVINLFKSVKVNSAHRNSTSNLECCTLPYGSHVRASSQCTDRFCKVIFSLGSTIPAKCWTFTRRTSPLRMLHITNIDSEQNFRVRDFILLARYVQCGGTRKKQKADLSRPFLYLLSPVEMTPMVFVTTSHCTSYPHTKACSGLSVRDKRTVCLPLKRLNLYPTY